MAEKGGTGGDVMTLTGYRFMATGVTEYAFYDGSNRLLRVCHTALPTFPVRIP